MAKTTRPAIHIGQYIVTGTDSLFTANQAILKLLTCQRCGLQEARYRIDGKTIVIKPRSQTT